MLSIKVLGLRSYFTLLSRIAPEYSKKAALDTFLSPPHAKDHAWEKVYLQDAEVITLPVRDKTIKVYRWGFGPSVLLIHGWGGRSTQFGEFIKPLLNSGFGVIAFDGPAHGNSSGKQTDVFEFAEAIHSVIQYSGNVHAVIAHSFGAAATLIGMSEYDFTIPKLIMIGCPASPIWVTNDFGKKLSIPPHIIDGMRELLRKRYNNQWTWEDLSIINMIKKTNMPILLIHDQEDPQVPYQNAIELSAAHPSTKLITTRGQGHLRILRSPEVIEESLKFIKGV
jgi:pimeloyl-ACP methyl ester carboxylesterase